MMPDAIVLVEVRQKSCNGATSVKSPAMKSLTIFFLHGCAGCISLIAAAPVPSAAPVFQAIRSADFSALDPLLAAGGDVLQARDEAGDTPLMAAALTGDVAVVRRLLEAGADVNATNAAGVTPLMRAATFEEAVRLLVEKGADVTARSKMGNSAVLLAARKPGNSGTVAFLLDHGADANAENAFKATALMAAVASDDVETVRLLLDRGADVNRVPKPGSENFFWGGWRTPLMWAAYLGDEAMCRLLLERGARVNDFVETGSALGQAAWAGQAGVARLLLDAGANVDQRDLVANYTPLHWAASSERSSPELVELLLARGADANAEGGQSVDNFLGVSQTPLMLARKRGDTPIVRALLKAGAREVASADRGGKPSPSAPAMPSGSPLEALQRAVPPLTKTAEESVPTFLRHVSHQDCVSCHQQQLPLPALSLAHSRHAATDRAATRHQVELARRSFFTGHIQHGGESHAMLEVNLQTTFHPEPAISDGYFAFGFRLENEPASVVTDSMVHQLATIQFADGHWSRNLPRPPMQASDITATAQAIDTLRTYPIPSRQKELASRVQRARDWLAKADAETNEERVHQLLGLAWAGAPPETLKPLAEALTRQQRDDGGWAQLAGLGSDAYATGQSLYALIEAAHLPPAEGSVRRGIHFLLTSQRPDGTWHVRTRSHPFQPPMDSGFPHGRDGWISAAGTSWAVMALAAAVDPAAVTPAPAPVSSTPAATPVALPTALASTSIEFTRDIQPLLEKCCAACHIGDRAKGGFSMANRASFLQGGNRGEPVVVPNRPEASPLFRIVQDQVEDLEMPPLEKRHTYPAWSKNDIALLAAWISRGAPWPDTATLHPPEN